MICLLFTFGLYSAQEIWTRKKANTWYNKQAWLTGSNYLPSSAINQLEMFQESTFNTTIIEKELTIAKSLGFNTMRVFLHDLLWQQDAEGFKQRIDIFLSICSRYNIKPLFVFFDSCWDPYPHAGKQRSPIEGLHNSGWIQSPGADILKNEKKWSILESYVKDIINTFGKDERILAWDIWNEPDNINEGSYQIFEPINKIEIVIKLLPKVFSWARSQNPIQPLTSGVWTGEAWKKSDYHNLSTIQKLQFDYSDIITFHSYSDPISFEKAILSLKTWGRPIICTEYMARGMNNTVINIMPLGKKYNIGLINWGFIDGKEQTKYPWDSWKKKYTNDPPLWHHVLFHSDYLPYKSEEIRFIKSLRK
ncbi:1,4-beta-xylanase [Elizabethkingia anophelis]|nr:1,4-beta-xylanase [Elizabethkingia anophelis]MDV3842077.1 1,4-beta-xylanase [Elizabethkingia anophelis]